MTQRLEDATSVLVPTAVVETTLEVLRRFGQRGCEGLVLWVGSIENQQARVETALVPDQHAIRNESGVGYFVEGPELFQLNRTLQQSRQRLLVQVHSHPREAYHSAADDEYAIVTAEGGFSLVVPDFGNSAAAPSAWAVYRLLKGRWQHIDPVIVERTFRLVASGR